MSKTNIQFVDEKVRPAMEEICRSILDVPETLDEDECGRVMDFLRLTQEATVVSDR